LVLPSNFWKIEEVQCGDAQIESILYKIYERLKEKRKGIGFASWWRLERSCSLCAKPLIYRGNKLIRLLLRRVIAATKQWQKVEGLSRCLRSWLKSSPLRNL
jgi:hypothetical protein